jgi:hypothetical protein
MPNFETKSSPPLNAKEALNTLLDQADIRFNKTRIEPILQWVRGLKLTGGIFDLASHPWQPEILESDCHHIVLRTAAQLGKTTVFILKILHGLISGKYPQGFIYAAPTEDSALGFSKSRFSPMIQDNPKIRELVNTTDSASLKRVGSAFLSFVGSQMTTTVGDGMKRTSTSLVSTPSDGYLVDEVDRVPPRALDLLSERLSHSKVKDEFFVSTPTIPGYGIDALFEETDQRQWHIKCSHCGEYTCLETEFPNSVILRPDGTAFRACKKCRKEIHSANGIWVPAYPDRTEKRGYHISQLNSPFMDPAKILKAYEDGANPSEFWNSKLGMPFIEAENRLTIADVYANCGTDPMATSHKPPTAIGLDIGKMIHCVVVVRPNNQTIKVIYAARVSSFADVSDICERFGVKCAVADALPETRSVREWQASLRIPAFLCEYSGTTGAAAWNESDGKLRVNRTEALDAVHHALTTPGKITLPRRCSEIEEFAKECTNSVRMIEEDSLGGRRMVWRPVGADHFQHSLSYALLAASRIGICEAELTPEQRLRRDLLQMREDNYDPLTFGLEVNSR